MALCHIQQCKFLSWEVRESRARVKLRITKRISPLCLAGRLSRVSFNFQSPPQNFSPLSIKLNMPLYNTECQTKSDTPVCFRAQPRHPLLPSRPATRTVHNLQGTRGMYSLHNRHKFSWAFWVRYSLQITKSIANLLLIPDVLAISA